MSWTGVEGIRTQDMMVQEDQDGPICRRWEEHLGTTDRGIVGSRRLLLNLADQLREGVEPKQPWHPKAYRIHSVGITAPREADPIELWNSRQPVPVGTTAIGAVE